MGHGAGWNQWNVGRVEYWNNGEKNSSVEQSFWLTLTQYSFTPVFSPSRRFSEPEANIPQSLGDPPGFWILTPGFLNFETCSLITVKGICARMLGFSIGTRSLRAVSPSGPEAACDRRAVLCYFILGILDNLAHFSSFERWALCPRKVLWLRFSKPYCPSS